MLRENEERKKEGREGGGEREKERKRKADLGNKVQKSDGHLSSNFMNRCYKNFINNLLFISTKATMIKNCDKRKFV